MRSQTIQNGRMSIMTGRYENTDEYYHEDWERKINTDSDENRRVWGPSQELGAEAAAVNRTPNTITTEQVNQILQGEGIEGGLSSITGCWHKSSSKLPTS